ncbi:MAG: class I SAM-dependent methyltransferase [Elusimicrobia bacterium]|nr:class I SAM-dependent methyltransferase [Elusimicrobiota bacterium]
MEHLEAAHYADPLGYQAAAEGRGEAMFASRLDLITRHRAPGRLLDVGCGKGEFLSVARTRGWAVAGIEPSQGLCEHARAAYGLDVRLGTLETAGAEAAAFDAVTLNHVLEHVERPLELLRGARGLLKPDGLLFVEVPNCDSYLLRAADAYFRLRGLDWSSRLSPLHPPFHRFGFTVASLLHALRAAGLEPVELVTYSGKGRGYRGGRGLAAVMRGAAAALLDLLPNRELLAALARPLR